MKWLPRSADTSFWRAVFALANANRRGPAPHPGGDGMIGEGTMSAHSETEHLREQLLRAQRLSSVGTLASSVAHEFNNILTTIMNYAKLGLKPESSDASKQQA